MGDEPREFRNPFQDSSARQDLTADGFESDFLTKLSSCRTKLRHKLESDRETFESHDATVYTGTTGVAYLYWRLSHCLPTEDERSSAFGTSLNLVRDALQRRKQKRVTFLCGDAGPLALGAVLFRDERAGQDAKTSDKCISDLYKMGSKVIVDDQELPDEILYGRVGYLYALLFIYKHLGSIVTEDVKGLVSDVVDAVLRSGQRLAKEERSSAPLMFQWHDRHYVGAAHGISGICAMLLQTVILFPGDLTLKAKVEKFVRPTLDFVIQQRFSSGNFPSSLESGSKDKLLHWCHGAPGVIYSLLFAHRVFADPNYLQLAVDCGEVIWRRGILRKGYGLCHGVAGNAYAFVALLHVTRDRKYAYRASMFAKWMFDYGKHSCRRPDRPCSLFEGLAGTLLFLYEMDDLEAARFPAFDLT